MQNLYSISARTLAIAATLSLASAPVAMAQTAPIMAFGEKVPTSRATSVDTVRTLREGVQIVNVSVGKSEVIDLPRDAADIFIANPAIVNAVVKSARRLFLVGMNTGTTALYVMDADGNRFANIEIQVTQDLTLLKQVLKHTIPTADIEARVVGNMVVLTGEVDTQADAAQASEMANAFLSGPTGGGSSGGSMGGAISAASATSGGGAPGAQSRVINSLTIRAKDQVMLRVTVAEVNRNVLKQLGISTSGKWHIGNNIFDFAGPATGLFNPLTGNKLGGAYSSPSKVCPAGVDKDGNPISGPCGAGASLNAMEQNGLARMLAEPTLTAQSGETATFQVGGKIPIPQPVGGGSESGSVSVKMEEFGVSLAFTPIVLGPGRISLRVSTSVSDIDQSIGINIPAGANGELMLVPGLRVRASETTVELPSGGSLMTAGLIQQDSRQSIGGIPGVSSLPVLGALARSRDYMRRESELMIIITPYLAKSVSAKDLQRPDKNLRDPSDVAGVALGQLNAITGSRTAKPVPNALNGAGFIVK